MPSVAWARRSYTVHRTRAIYSLDARTQTEYGTLRAYTIIGYTHETPGNATNGQGPTIYATRAFLQFAGFTLGKASSFYDIWSVPANTYFAVWSSDSGDGGVMLAAYTFQFGNGFSATLAAEDPRRNVVVNTSIAGGPGFPLAATAAANPFLVGAVATADQVSIKFPDLVANLRVDQAWGSFQVMGALHDNSGYNFVPSSAAGLCNVVAFGGTLTGQIACGGPDDKLGFAVGVGGIFKIPMPGGLTDTASFQFNYTEGASRYAVITQPSAGSPNMFGSSSLATCPTFRARRRRPAAGLPRLDRPRLLDRRHLRQSGVRLRRLRPEHPGVGRQRGLGPLVDSPAEDLGLRRLHRGRV